MNRPKKIDLGSDEDRYIALATLVALIFIILAIHIQGCDEFLSEARTDRIIELSDFYISIPEERAIIGIRCRPDCPTYEEIKHRIELIMCKYEEKLGYKPTYRKTLHNFTIVFASDERPYKGAVSYTSKMIYIYYPHVCPPYIKGLCPSIFDWEIGNILLEEYFAKQGKYWVPEREKHEFRRERNLFQGCDPWQINYSETNSLKGE
jgi:hypothetical protein